MKTKDFRSIHNLKNYEKKALVKVLNNEINDFNEAMKYTEATIFDLLQYLFDTLMDKTIECYDEDNDIVYFSLDGETALKVCSIVLKQYINN